MSLPPDEVRAAAEVHRELGPDYQHAVIESFLDKVGREIDARVDARLAASMPAARQARGSAFTLAVVSISLGIPLTAISLAVGRTSFVGLTALLVIWVVIGVINVAYARQGSVPPPGRR
jgi:hypothetical protein